MIIYAARTSRLAYGIWYKFTACSQDRKIYKKHNGKYYLAAIFFLFEVKMAPPNDMLPIT